MQQLSFFTQPDSESFDWQQGDREKARGMQLAARNRGWLLEHARDLAKAFAQRRPLATCTFDDVMRQLIAEGFKPEELGNAAGSVFKTADWECVGWKQSKRISNHARAIRIWKLIK